MRSAKLPATLIRRGAGRSFQLPLVPPSRRHTPCTSKRPQLQPAHWPASLPPPPRALQGASVSATGPHRLGEAPEAAVNAGAAGAGGHRRRLLAPVRSGSPGRIPQALVDAHNPANNPRRPAGGSGSDGTAAAVSAAAAAAAASFGASHYKQVLGLSYLFYEAQRSGALPASNRVGWRRSCNLRDRVVGGYLDAGDTIKHGLTTAETVTFLAWAALDFRQGHATGEAAAGQAAAC